MRKTLAQHAADHLIENGHRGIMWGDVGLTHEILDRAEHQHRGPRSNRLLMNALEGSPLFIKSIVRVGGRRLRCFDVRSPVSRERG